MNEEKVDIVDDQDNIVRTTTRKEMREKALLHRSSYIIVEDDSGKFLIQKRSKNKDVFPGIWDLGAGETLQAGESYETAASRGLKEELGIEESESLEYLFDTRYRSKELNTNYKVYKSSLIGPIIPDKTEIDDTKFAPPSEILNLWKEGEFTPDGFIILKKFLASRTSAIGHRGAGFLEPENTVQAVNKGIELGMDIVEVDLRITKDSNIVVYHDETLERTSNTKGRLSDFDFADLKRMQAGKGEKIPQVEDILEAARGKAMVLLELKDAGMEEIVVNIIEGAGASSFVTVISFSREAIRRVKEISSIPTGLIFAELDNPVREALDIDADIILVKHTKLTPEIVDNAHENGLKVFAWNPDTKEDIEFALFLGVDAIASNKPDLLMKVLRE